MSGTRKENYENGEYHRQFASLHDKGLLEDGLNKLKQHPEMTKLTLKSCILKDARSLFTTLKEFKQLNSIDLTGNFIESNDAKSIAGFLEKGFPTLTVLNLTNNEITFDGALQLVRAAGKRKPSFSLHLSNNKLGVEEYKRLVLRGMQYSSLSLDLTDSYAPDLNTVIEEFKYYQYRVLRLPKCTPKSGEVEKLCDAIEANQKNTLEYLDFSNCKLDDEVGAGRLLGLKSKCPKLKMKFAPQEVKCDGEDLSGFNLGFILAKLSVFPVTKLNLSNCGLTDEDIKQLAKVIEENQILNLKELNLSGNKMTVVGANILFNLSRKFSGLKIDIENNAIAPQELVYKASVDPKEMLARLKFYPVKKLILQNFDLKDVEMIQQLVSAIKTYQKNTLPSLYLSPTEITAESAPVTEGPLPLQIILEYRDQDLSGPIFETILELLSLVPVTKLKLSNCNLSDEHIIQLIKVLGENRLETLTELDLSGNKLTCDCIFRNMQGEAKSLGAEHHLVDFVKASKALKFLNLSNNNINDLGADALGGEFTASSLTEMSFYGNPISSTSLYRRPVKLVGGNSKTIQKNLVEASKSQPERIASATAVVAEEKKTTAAKREKSVAESAERSSKSVELPELSPEEFAKLDYVCISPKP